MDKLYKPYFLSQLKARMQFDRPEFVLQKVNKDHPSRARFTGSLLYLQQLPGGPCVWLEWFPGEGVEREFYVYIGWSFNPVVLPINQAGDARVHSAREPIAGVPAGALNVQQVEGRQAIAGFRIATPWDQLYALGPRASEAEHKRVMNKAYAEYLALTEAERVEAVRVAMNEAFAAVASVLPRFTIALQSLAHDA